MLEQTPLQTKKKEKKRKTNFIGSHQDLKEKGKEAQSNYCMGSGPRLLYKYCIRALTHIESHKMTDTTQIDKNEKKKIVRTSP